MLIRDLLLPTGQSVDAVLPDGTAEASVRKAVASILVDPADGKLSLGAWPIEIRSEGGRYTLSELSRDGRRFIRGIDHAVEIWSAQQSVCEETNTPYTPVSAWQLAAVSDDFYELDYVQGLRLPSPPHMSGWWLWDETAEEVDFSKFATVHVHHCIVSNPGIAMFLGLPAHFRFFQCIGMVLPDPPHDA